MRRAPVAFDECFDDALNRWWAPLAAVAPGDGANAHTGRHGMGINPPRGLTLVVAGISGGRLHAPLPLALLERRGTTDVGGVITKHRSAISGMRSHLVEHAPADVFQLLGRNPELL